MAGKGDSCRVRRSRQDQWPCGAHRPEPGMAGGDGSDAPSTFLEFLEKGTRRGREQLQPGPESVTVARDV